MLTPRQRQQLVAAIHSVPDLAGVRIGYYGELTCDVLSMGMTPSLNFARRVVIVEEAPASHPVATELQEIASPPPTFISNRSRSGAELTGAGLSCGFAVIAGIGVLGSAAAEVPTGGLSTFLLVASWTGFATASVQCINGLVRSNEVINSPDSNSLQQWDSNTIYTTSMFVVDFLGVASGLAALPQATRNLLAILERRGGLLTVEMLAQTNRAERAAMIQAAVRQASQNPESRAVLEQALREAGALRQATAGASASVRVAETTVGVVSRETTRRLTRAVLDVIGGTAGPVASGLPSAWVGSASGSVNTIGGLVINLVPVSG